MLRGFILIIFLFQATLVFAQQEPNPYRIKKAKSFGGDKCKEYRAIVRKLPNDVRYDIVVEDRLIYFTIPSIDHFQKLFDKNRDGIAIDIVHKDQYKCGEDSPLEESWPSQGYMLAPMYKKELEEIMFFDDLNNVVIKYGRIPEQFNPSEVECNILTLQSKALCDYTSIVNIDYGSWDLLETGLYWDSIPETKGASNIQTFLKTMEFTIPFEKNKTRFLAADIKPLYDSLDLTDYDIMEISILAYSSVEGTVEQNEMLQKGRAQSIVDALQAYQSQEIKTNIITKENWSQFAEDISGTEFRSLKKYSKEEIRNSLFEDRELLDALEPMLKKQRKGLVKLVLQNKVSVYESDPEKLKEFFHHSLTEADLKQAIFLQHVIFERIRAEKLPDEFINQLEIPKESSFGPLFNNILLFNFERLNTDLYQTIEALENLQSLIPNSFKLKYNLLALKLKAWSEGSSLSINRDTLGKQINELNKTGIHPSLLERLKINYHLLLSQYLTYEKDFRGKSKSIKTIYHHYRKLALQEEEALSLAKFMASNSEFKLAEDVLYPKVKSENVSEDLLFYYLNLTIGNPRSIRTTFYQGLLEKAVSLNKARYCELFLPKPQGGFSFQLKSDKILKDSYCENCKMDLP